MSLSPRDLSDPDQVFRYRKAWAAINLMLERGRSLSGRERNCAFLNTGGTRFADISAASGLDLLDDGRGVALVDWDLDGRMDFWTSNRTGPSIRLLHNLCQNGHHFLAVKLEGRTCNRDAIGARVELRIGGDSPRTLYKSIRAGEGFVSQSSKQVLFGLGKQDRIDRLVVHWPGGEVEEYAELFADMHYRIVQGEGQAHPWSPPSPPLLHEVPEKPSISDEARIVLVTRLPLPDAKFREFNGRAKSLTKEIQRPTLINLWASWCAPCMTELKDWRASADKIDNRFDIIALNADGLDSGQSVDSATIERSVANLQLPFHCALATREVVEVLEVVSNSLVDKPQPLVVPMSLLLDVDGRVAVIYRGNVDLERVLEDVSRLDASPEERRNQSAHFPGRWFEGPPATDPAIIVRNFVLAGRLAAAESYLERWREMVVDESGTPLLESYYLVADAHRAMGEYEDAVGVFRQALRFQPDQPRVNQDLAITLLHIGRANEAIPHLEVALRANPGDTDTRKRLVLALAKTGRFVELEEQARSLVVALPRDALAHLHLAFALKKQARFEEAIASYRNALSAQPTLITAQNDLAWMLATCEDNALRNGSESLRLSEQTCLATGHRQPALLDTLAAAQAEMGRFKAAVETIEKAIALAGAANDESLKTLLQQRLELYRRNLPYREGARDDNLGSTES